MQNQRSLKWNLTVAFAGLMLFFAMGLKFIPLYSLWDDEANTALFAQSVHESGDTSAVRGINEIAYRNGAELNDDKKSALRFALAVLFSRSLYQNDCARSRRSAFAIFLFVSPRADAYLSTGAFVKAFFALDDSVAHTYAWTFVFFLFSFQCRYYALSLFFGVCLADTYFFSDWSRRRNIFLFSLFGALLFVSNYLIGVAAFSALFLHAIIFRRKEVILDPKRMALFAAPQVILSFPVFLIWNPLGKTVVTIHNSPLDRLNLFYRNVRDFNGGHFGSLLLLLAGLYFLKDEAKDRFKQYGLIFVTYLAVISIFSPQPVHGTGVADIRYLYPLVILGFAWAIDLAAQVRKRSPRYFWPLVLFFGFCSLPYSAQLQLPLVNLVQEYQHPADDPYRAVGQWLNEKASPGESVLSSLDYATYPLMYLAPQVHYLGQRGELQAPDYLVSFCEDGVVNRYPNVHYTEAAQFNVSCREKFRPEIFLRSFGKNPGNEVVRIFKKSP